MAGRPKIFEEKEVVSKAIELFWQCGYESTSTEDLLAVMHLNKGSLYHHFGSKKDLFIMALDQFTKNFIADFTRSLNESKRPVQVIKQFFLDIAASTKAYHKNGCFIGNTLAEQSNLDKDIEKKAVANLKLIEDVFYKYISTAQKEGSMKTTEDARVLARYLINLWNGINITRRMYPGREQLEPLLKMQLEVLK